MIFKRVNESFKMPRCINHDNESGDITHKMISATINAVLKEEILKTADTAAVQYLKSLKNNKSYIRLDHSPFIAAVDDNDLTYRPFMRLTCDNGEYTIVFNAVVSKYVNIHCLFADFFCILDEFGKIVELAVTEDLGVTVSVKFECFEISPKTPYNILRTIDKINIVSLADVINYTNYLKPIINSSAACLNGAAYYYNIARTALLVYGVYKNKSHKLKLYNDFICKRLLHPVNVDIMLIIDNSANRPINQIKCILDDLRDMSSEEIVSGPQPFLYIDFSNVDRLFELGIEPDFSFIRERNLPIGIVTACHDLLASRYEELNDAAGWDLTKAEHDNLCDTIRNFMICNPKSYYCIIWPADGIIEFLLKDNKPVIPNHIKGVFNPDMMWSIESVRTKGPSQEYMDESFKMPAKRQDLVSDSDLTHRITKMTFPVFENDVKEFAEEVLIRNTPMTAYSGCPFRFLKFSSYNDPSHPFLTPSLSLKPEGDGYLLTIKSCAIESLNKQYYKYESGLTSNEPIIEIGGRLLELDSTMKFLEDELTAEYGMNFKVKMELVDLGDSAEKIWLDNLAWMAEIDVYDYAEAESLVKHAVDIPFPCIPAEFEETAGNRKTPCTFNLHFSEFVTYKEFIDFVKNRVTLPNTVNEFNLLMGNSDISSFIDSLYADAQYFQDSPIKIASLDFTRTTLRDNAEVFKHADLSKLSKIFSDAPVKIPYIFVKTPNKVTMDIISDATNGIYTADTQAWLAKEHDKLMYSHDIFIYYLIWYPDTNEICYVTNNNKIYNIPKEFLGTYSKDTADTEQHAEELPVDEAFKIPTKKQAADSPISSDAIEKLTVPVIIIDLKNIASKAISEYRSKFDVMQQIPIIRCNDRDEITSDGTEYVPDIQVVYSDGTYKMSIPLRLPTYSNGKINGVIFYMTAGMFDYIKHSLDNNIISSTYNIEIRAKFFNYQDNDLSQETKLIDETQPFIHIVANYNSADASKISYIETFDKFIFNYTDQSNADTVIAIDTMVLNKNIIEDFGTQHNLYCKNIRYVLELVSCYDTNNLWTFANMHIAEPFGIMLGSRFIYSVFIDSQLSVTDTVYSTSHPSAVAMIFKMLCPKVEVNKETTEHILNVFNEISAKTGRQCVGTIMPLIWKSGELDFACEKLHSKTYKPIRQIIPVIL